MSQQWSKGQLYQDGGDFGCQITCLVKENGGNVTLRCDLGTIDGTVLVASPPLISQNVQVPLKTQQEAKTTNIQNKINVVNQLL